MTGNAPRVIADAAPSRRCAGFFFRAGRWCGLVVAGGFIGGVGLLLGILFASTVIRLACVSMKSGGFGG